MDDGVRPANPNAGKLNHRNCQKWG